MAIKITPSSSLNLRSFSSLIFFSIAPDQENQHTCVYGGEWEAISMNLHGKHINPEIIFLVFPKPMYLFCAVERGKMSDGNENREQSAEYF